jgi:sodium/bile acid cotransporter 7
MPIMTSLLPQASLGVMARSIGRFHPDGFVIALIGAVTLATLLPCQGMGARIFHSLGSFAIASLFFLQGARLSRAAVVAGATHWRLHVAIASTTFALFPLLGLGLWAVVPDALPRSLWLGVVFVCVLPSTVQSSIASTSIAQGNVAAAVCSATGSNLAGLVLSPVLFGLLSSADKSTVSVAGIQHITLQLLVPFIAGHLLRPWIGQWAERNRSILAVTDRGSILLIVYAVFSASIVQGLWQELPPATMAALALVDATLLAAALLVMITGSRVLGFDRADQSTIVFCGSQKSVVSGIAIANALIAGPALGLFVLPIMIYHAMQLVVCAWLAKRYAKRYATRPHCHGNGVRERYPVG